MFCHVRLKRSITKMNVPEDIWIAIKIRWNGKETTKNQTENILCQNKYGRSTKSLRRL